ncbi:hypothetical protein PAV_4c04540 [Paenibacillus alvei DSM 29]|uniref:hypothetical protein n=1 Tax=Paenibacillus alvei TaxID=44250 RepID=UPI000287ABBB|nr:hypothetical protein [Paenibacillus alvei]EJW17349.1 hypothetical protein PAV_4c04540 [Paenibacillus alvei DSM 29]
MIHIVNGECTARQLSSIAEQRWKEKVWVYSELLTEGPVYARLEQYLAYRALQLERMCGLPSTVFCREEMNRNVRGNLIFYPLMRLHYGSNTICLTLQCYSA